MGAGFTELSPAGTKKKRKKRGGRVRYTATDRRTRGNGDFFSSSAPTCWRSVPSRSLVIACHAALIAALPAILQPFLSTDGVYTRGPAALRCKEKTVLHKTYGLLTVYRDDLR